MDMWKNRLLNIIFIAIILLDVKCVFAMEKENLNVLIIEINPTIQRITNSKFANNGHPKVSEYFNQDLNAAINEVKKDLEETSHGYLKVKIVKHEYLNEYPKYKNQVKLSNGSYSYRLDEETYLQKAKYNGGIHGDWFDLQESGILKSIPEYSFDYDYIINKYNLIERKKKNEFDQVWLLTIDPAQTYETIMIGNNPFWINAPGYIADCPNFIMANFSISRRDANLHALGHGIEGIMTAAYSEKYVLYSAYENRGKYKYYSTSFSSYNYNDVDVDNYTYDNLNLWEKFTLGKYSNSNPSKYSSVGSVHYPFNGTADYDYSNKNKVLTNWREWLNYPNIKGEFVLDNNSAWLNNAGNNKLDSSQNKDPDRLYTRFWLYLMPHIEGYTEDGHYNNWWKYFKTLDFVTDIKPVTNQEITVKTDQVISIKYKLSYNSGKTVTKEIEPQYSNVRITGKSVEVSKNKLVAVKEGRSVVTIYHDNKSVTYTINVQKGEEKMPPITPESVIQAGGNNTTTNNDKPSVNNPTIDAATNDIITNNDFIFNSQTSDDKIQIFNSTKVSNTKSSSSFLSSKSNNGSVIIKLIIAISVIFIPSLFYINKKRNKIRRI